MLTTSQDNRLRHIIKLTWKLAVLKKVPTGLRLALLLASHSLTRGWATLRLIPDSGFSFSSCSSSWPASRPSSSSLIPGRAHTAAGASSAARGRERAATYLLAVSVRTRSRFQLRLKLKWLSTFHLFVNSSQVNWSPVSQTKKSQIRQQAVLV